MSTAVQNDAVTLLWKLSHLCKDRKPEGLPFVHFTQLLSNESYRERVVDAASAVEDEEIRLIAGSLRKNFPRGNLSRSEEISQQKAAAAVEAARSPWARNRTELRGVLGLATVAALAYGLISFTGWFDGVRSIEGDITESTTWKSGQTIRLDGLTYVTGASQLTIEPGVTVLGTPGSALVVTRDARLHARGTAQQPIVFTSANPVGARAPGDWGGVVLLGRAPVNTGTAIIEGIEEANASGSFGGNDGDSSCGVLEYVRIEFAGFEVYANNELNGLTLGGCGAGTIVRNVQIHRALDDGLELFGGTADIRNVLITYPGDDGLDWDLGWVGRGQFIAVLMGKSTGDNANEADNRKEQPDAMPRSSPTLFNLSLVGHPSAEIGQRGMVLRRGTGGHFSNVLISGFAGEPFDLRDASTAALARNGGLRIVNSVLMTDGSQAVRFQNEDNDHNDDEGLDELAWFSQPDLGNVVGAISEMLNGLRGARVPGLVPLASRDLMRTAQTAQDEFWQEGVDYVGAFRPGASRTWASGWTALPEN